VLRASSAAGEGSCLEHDKNGRMKAILLSRKLFNLLQRTVPQTSLSDTDPSIVYPVIPYNYTLTTPTYNYFHKYFVVILILPNLYIHSFTNSQTFIL
jgi:hypothetical protein